LTFLPDLVWYRRLPSAFLPALIFPPYIGALFFIHHNFADGTAWSLLFKDGRIIYTMAIFIFFAHLRPTVRFEPLLFRAVVITVAVLSIFCLVSYFVKPLRVGTAQLASPHGAVTGLLGANTQAATAGKSAAEVATTNSKNAMAFALGAVIAFIAAAWLHGFKRERPDCCDWLTLVLAIPIGLAFVLAKSRGCDLALGAAVAVIGFIMVRRNRRWLGLLTTGAAVAGLMFLASNAQRNERQMDRNIGHRFIQGEKALKLWAQSPVFGVGVGTFEFVDKDMQSLVPYLLAVRRAGRPTSGSMIEIGEHPTSAGQPTYNSYLKILLDFGLVGLGLYAAWYWQAFRRGLEVWRSPAEGRDMVLLREHAIFNATVVALSLLFIAVQSMTESQCLIGPSGHVIYAAAFGRLVAQSELLRSFTPGHPPA
jgi:O-antigen ligase